MQVKTLIKDQEKRALIKRLSDQKVSLMFFYEEEPGESVPHERVDEFITFIHPPYDYETLEKWLYLGNWQAISPGNNAYRPFNTFKSENSEIEQRMKEFKAKIIIDSFHDDIEWNVIEET